MAYLYILKGKTNKHYIGITVLDPEVRLKRHNKGDVYSTKFHRSWQLIYSETFPSIKEARVKEKQIKSWKGGNAFKKFLSSVAGSSNGRTSAFGAEYLGSNPSPAAEDRSNKFGGVK